MINTATLEVKEKDLQETFNKTKELMEVHQAKVQELSQELIRIQGEFRLIQELKKGEDEIKNEEVV